MLDDLAELLALKSIQEKPENGAPFGKPLRETLDWFLQKAESYGLKTENLNGYCGYGEYGAGKDLMGILCHLDVVPAGDKWSVPAYQLTKKDGFLYGRGVVDDKGPAIVMLHVLKKLREEQVPLKHRVRLIVGCNEETGSACMAHYVKHAEIPAFSIVPDADFPVINSEKGILHLKISLPVSSVFCDNIAALNFGDRANVVPDAATAAIQPDSQLEKLLCEANLSCTMEKLLLDMGQKPDAALQKSADRHELETLGTAGHAMAPEKADNAAWKLFAVLAKFLPEAPEISRIYGYLCSPHAKARLGIDYADEKSGALTLNLGAGEYMPDNGVLRLTLDLRLPLCADKDAVIAAVLDKIGCGATAETLYYAPNLYIDPDSRLIRAVLTAYEKTMGGKATPLKTGGGTYARHFPHAAAFGPTFPDTETHIHDADERIKKEQFDKLFDIYYAAVLELDNI